MKYDCHCIVGVKFKDTQGRMTFGLCFAKYGNGR